MPPRFHNRRVFSLPDIVNMHIRKEIGSKTEPMSLGVMLFRSCYRKGDFSADERVREDSL